MASTVSVRTVRVKDVRHGDVIRFEVGNGLVSNWLEVEHVEILSYAVMVHFKREIERRFPNGFVLVELQELKR